MPARLNIEEFDLYTCMLSDYWLLVLGTGLFWFMSGYWLLVPVLVTDY